MLAQSYNCLIIAPILFGYAKEIQAGLAERGLHALLFDDRPATDTFTKSLIRISPRLLRSKADKYFAAIIQQAAAYPIREVLVIKGQALSAGAIQRMRAALPAARFTLYFWDSYKNMSADSPGKVALFDRSFTFDPLDAQADPRLQYRPLFYVDAFANLPDVKQDLDVLFLGTMHSDRYRVLKSLEKALPKTVRITKILYFPSPLIYLARKIFDPSFWRARSSEFIFQPVPRTDQQLLVARSRIVVDIERPVQSGLTIRTVETIGARKKLITTNPFAGRADVYRPENILVIDRESMRVPEDWLSTNYRSLPDELRSKYSLAGWLAEVFPEYGCNAGNS